MCGINGFNFLDRERILKMNEVLMHRGPDDTGIALEAGWSLGNNRLAIIDLSPLGHQPMKSHSGRYTIVYNGELYNCEEIRQELKEEGIPFRSQSDTEVIVNAFEEWGEECLERFNGMFAFSILDNESGKLFLARDQCGIKPLYYFHGGARFMFSSEIKSFFAHDIPRTIDLEMLNVYFRLLYVPAPKTIFKNIFKVEPGHYLTVTREGKIEDRAYWNFKNEPLVRTKEEAIAGIQTLLKDSVKRQLVSDRPVGIFLSGGIDSTIITGIASDLHPSINTFSVGFTETEESQKYNSDLETARETARHFGTTHHEYTLSAEDVLGNLGKAIYHMDEPIANHVQAVNMLLAERVRDTATVVLGGDGGDELFGGYERYYYARLLGYLPLDKADLYLRFFAQKEPLVASFLRSGHNMQSVTREYIEKLYFSKPSGIDIAREFMRTDMKSWLPSESLVRSDKMGMAASIEQRVPFLDRRLVEFADRIPSAWKIGAKGRHIFSVGIGYTGKQILREAMKEYLPPFVLGKQKWGWFSPAAKWIRGPMLPLMREVLSPTYNPGTSNMFDFVALNRMLDDHITKRRYALTPLWAVLTFQLWYKQFMK